MQSQDPQLQYNETQTTIRQYSSDKLPPDEVEELLDNIPDLLNESHTEIIPPPTGVKVGPVGIDYGSLWMDALAGVLVIVFCCFGYIGKKYIDKKFK